MANDGLLFTIGHSTHEWPAFLALVERYEVTAVADVRSQPVSRLPQFDRANFAESLKRAGLEYVFLGRELGARRTEPECYADGRVVYERVAELPAFHTGIDRLLRGARTHRIALVCAEKEPLECHRTILVCRHLRDRGLRIRHILAAGEIEEHADAERRLMRLTGVQRTLFEPDLTPAELLDRAYEQRGREIAYRTDPEGDAA